MSRIRLRYIQAWVDGDGRVHRYFRRPGFPRVPLPGLPGSSEFMAAYGAALEGPAFPIGAAKRSKPGSVSAVIAEYYDSQQAFGTLGEGTKRARRWTLERFRDKHGDKPMAMLPREWIVRLLDGMSPSVARNWLKALRSLCQFAVKRGSLAADPTAGIKLATIKSDGIHTWTEDEIAQFEAHHPIGSKSRLAFALLLYTAQRRGDAIRLGRQHIKDGVLTVRQEKTGIALAIPIHPTLAAVLAATPSEHLTFLTTNVGKPYIATHFSQQFRDWCDAASLPKHCSAHGLRKAACRRLAEAGCSVNEIAAISGHKSLSEVQRYTEAVDQERMARHAMARALRTKNESEVSKFEVFDTSEG
jgi:integrase